MNLFAFFKAVHIGLLEFAKENPDIEVIIKPKKKVMASWQANFDRASREEYMDAKSIKNFKVDCLVDAQKLILESDVICGFNSTTILEAGITDKPVIIPFFGGIKEPPFIDHVKFQDAFVYFDVAESQEHLKKLINDGLKIRSITNKQKNGRVEAFRKYVCEPNGSVVARYENAIDKIISENSST